MARINLQVISMTSPVVELAYIQKEEGMSRSGVSQEV